jgi:hypothetical protein
MRERSAGKLAHSVLRGLGEREPVVFQKWRW